MQRCRLRLTALTLQNTRYHSINIRDKKKTKHQKQPKTDTKDQNPDLNNFKKKRFVHTEYLVIYFCRFCLHIYWTKNNVSVIKVIYFNPFRKPTALILHCEMRRCELKTSHYTAVLHLNWSNNNQCDMDTGDFCNHCFGEIFWDIFWTCLYIFSLHTCQIKCPFQL